MSKNVVADALIKLMLDVWRLDTAMDVSEHIVSIAAMRVVTSRSNIFGHQWNLDSEEDRLALLQYYHGGDSGHYDYKTGTEYQQAGQFG